MDDFHREQTRRSALRGLIGTHNPEKAMLASFLFRKAFCGFVWNNLRDIHLTPVANEIGKAKERATAKAIEYEQLSRQIGYSCDLVVGIDDEILSPRLHWQAEETKEITQEILHDGILKEGDRVTIKQWYAYCRRRRILHVHCVEVPFVYVPPIHTVEQRTGYPLNFVLAIPGSNRPVKEMGFAQRAGHFWRCGRVQFARAASVLSLIRL